MARELEQRVEEVQGDQVLDEYGHVVAHRVGEEWREGPQVFMGADWGVGWTDPGGTFTFVSATDFWPEAAPTYVVDDIDFE